MKLEKILTISLTVPLIATSSIVIPIIYKVYKLYREEVELEKQNVYLDKIREGGV